MPSSPSFSVSIRKRGKPTTDLTPAPFTLLVYHQSTKRHLDGTMKKAVSWTKALYRSSPLCLVFVHVAVASSGTAALGSLLRPCLTSRNFSRCILQSTICRLIRISRTPLFARCEPPCYPGVWRAVLSGGECARPCLSQLVQSVPG